MTKGFTEVLGVTHACMPVILHELCAVSCTHAADTVENDSFELQKH